jgi:hypothetical protein
MRNYFLAFVCSFFLASTCYAQTDTATNTSQVSDENIPAAIPAADEIDEVLIIGEQPGPSLWKVYKDDHVLWVLGTLSPLPKKMQWRSQQADNALMNSQELLLPPSNRLDVGFFSIAAAAPSLIGIQNNPDGSSLEEIIPPETYQQWLALKEKYIGKDKGIEKHRPLFAGVELIEKSIDKADLLNKDMAWEKVDKLAKKHKIKKTAPTLTFKIDSLRATAKKFKKSSMDDIPCFTQILTRIEPDLDGMRARANAWSVGDVEALSKLPVGDYESACFAAAMSSSISQEVDLKAMTAQMETLWLNSAEHSLATNLSTFAILPIAEILKRDGYIVKLRNKGYRVEGFGFDAPPSD